MSNKVIKYSVDDDIKPSGLVYVNEDYYFYPEKTKSPVKENKIPDIEEDGIVLIGKEPEKKTGKQNRKTKDRNNSYFDVALIAKTTDPEQAEDLLGSAQEIIEKEIEEAYKFSERLLLRRSK